MAASVLAEYRTTNGFTVVDAFPAEATSVALIALAGALPALAEKYLPIVGPDNTANATIIRACMTSFADQGGDSYRWRETTLLKGDVTQRVVLVALPAPCSRHNSAARPHAIRDALNSVTLEFPAAIVVAVPGAEYAAAAACAAARAFPLFTEKGKRSTTAREARLLVVDEAGTPVGGGAAKLQVLADSVRMAAALVDAPTSVLNTDSFLAAAEAVRGETGARMTVIRGEELRDRGFGGLWSVGRAAVHPPALAVLEHVPEGVAPDAPALVLVGKGIVYDTGGLSIKISGGMVGMKRDMGGAAAVLGAFRSLALWGGPWGGAAPRRVCAVLCLAENSVGPDATRPDDVIHMYSGKTVEVNNTDAEGRLVLGDGVAYAVKHLNPSLIVDAATLTGAQGIATGNNHSALYCNRDDLEAAALAAGRLTGDLAHPLPYAPEFYRKEFSSAVADMKNSVADRTNAQSSCAGQFIGNHLGDYEAAGRWLHVDMAYPVHKGERATGFGVMLLAAVAMHEAGADLKAALSGSA